MIGAKLGWFDPRLKTFFEQFLKEAKRKKITFYHVYDEIVKEGGKNEVKILGGEYRFIPNQYSTESAIDIFCDYIVTFTGLKLKKIDDDVTLFILRDEKLAESYRTWFKFIYDFSPKTAAKK